VPDAVLRTERVVLRPIDAAAARGLLDRPPVGGFPSADDTSLLHRTAAATDEVRHTYVLEHEGLPIGTLGIAGTVSPDGDQELGYALVPAAHGRGLGTEAVGALCAVLERVPGVRRLTAEVRPGNEASLRLLLRLGFVEVEGASQGHVRLGRVPPGAPSLSRRIAGRHVC
jgi:RimJ/RimL family protein N-acetyltransferase